MSDIEKTNEELHRFRRDPLALQRTWLDRLESVNNGQRTIVDPSNPFNQLMEATCFNTSMLIQQMETAVRRIYKSLSTSKDDLYYHLSDKDFVGLFATPSMTNFVLGLSLTEVKERAVKEDTSDVRKLVIPRHTEFNLGAYRFSLQYPIEIRVMPHGGLQVVYQTDQPTPLQVLSTNQVPWTLSKWPDHPDEFITIDIPAQQLTITPEYLTIQRSVGLIKNLEFTDQFCHARAWLSDGPDQWKEIPVVHQDIVHNLKEISLSVKVAKNTLRVELPPVYLTEENNGKTIRLDIYTTKGPLELDLSTFPMSEFGITWRDLNIENQNRFSAPLDSISNLFLLSDDRTRGGSEEVSYEVLRDRVLNNSQGNPSLPITQHQIDTMVSLRGYALVKYIDNLTDRAYHVARSLPAPTTGQLSTGANSTIRTVDLHVESLKTHESVWDNGDSVTLTPELIYQDEAGSIKVLTSQEVENIRSQPNEVIANDVNTNNYLFTPFYYVLDQINGFHKARAYHLDSPVVSAKRFVEENESTQLLMSSESYYLTKIKKGYRLTIITRSGNSVRTMTDDRLAFQLSYIPPGESDRAVVAGVIREVLDSGERVVDFDIETSYEIDRDHQIRLTNFQMYDDSLRTFTSNLQQTFDVMYFVKDHTAPGLKPSAIDDAFATWMDSSNWVGISHEELSLNLGSSLEQLWCEVRLVAGEREYQVWETDELAYWETDQWETTQDGRLALYKNSEGVVEGNLLHAAGDPKLDENGEQIYVHRAGTLKLVDGEPVLEEDRQLRHYLEMYLLEGTFRFTTDTAMIDYRESLANSVVTWLEEDLKEFRARLLERTDIFLHPRNELGEIAVIVGENRETYIRAEQSFTVTFHLRGQQYDNVDLRQSLTQTARQVVVEHLNKTTLSTSRISKEILELAEDSVLDVKVTGLGGVENNYPTVTLINPINRCSVRKRLINQANDVLAVTDEVQVKFIRHEGL